MRPTLHDTKFITLGFLQSDLLVQVLLFHFHFEGPKNGCDLEQKIVRFGINCTVESQSDCKDHQ